MSDKPSQPEENKDLVRRFNEDGLNKENYDVVDEIVADDFVEYSSIPREVTTSEEFIESRKSVRAAVPDLEISIEDLIAEGDKVVARTRERGTHKGEFQGIPPTGNEIDIQAIIIYRIEEDTITETWVQADMMSLMEQLGAFPPGPGMMLRMAARKLKTRLLGD